MKAKDIMRQVIGPEWVDTHGGWTVDRLKIGDPEWEKEMDAICKL